MGQGRAQMLYNFENGLYGRYQKCKNTPEYGWRQDAQKETRSELASLQRYTKVIRLPYGP